jgi:uncharacterized protein (TIGR02001 family)
MKLLTALLLTVAATAAQAQDTFVGVSLTTDYVVGSVSQTDGKPTLQAYAEHNLASGLYFGTFLSGVDFSEFGLEDKVEYDLYAGYRGAAGKLSYDIGYYRYYFNELGFDSDEIWLKANYAATDTVTVGANLRHHFSGRFNDEWLYGPTFKVALSEVTSVDGAVMANTLDDAVDWNVGLRQQLSPTVSASLRYYDSSFDEGFVAAAISFDTSLSALFAQ